MTDIDDIRAALRGFADRAPEPERVTSGLAGRMRAYRQRRVLLAAGAVAAGTVAVGVPGYLLLSPHGSRANLPSPPAEPSPGHGNTRARMYLRPTWLPDGVLEFSRQGRIGGSPYQLRTWGSPAFLAAARAGNAVVMDLTAVVSLQVDQPTPPLYSSPWPPESAPPTGPFNPLGEPPNTTVGRHLAVVSAGGGPLSLTWLLDGGVVARLYLRGTGGTPEDVLATARRIAESVVPDNTNGVEAGLHFGWLPDAVDTAVTSVDAFGVKDSWYQVVEITPGRGPGAWASLGSRPEASYLRGQTIAVRGRSGILSGNTVTVELDGDRWLQGRLVNLTDGGDYRVAVARLLEGIAIGPDAYRGWVGTR